jgi:hypothetical protein
MKPAVGFTLPSAGVTPAPSENREMSRTTFHSQVRGESDDLSSRLLLAGRPTN